METAPASPSAARGRLGAVTPNDALRALRPRLHSAAAESAHLALLEAQTAGASVNGRALIADAYARAWRELSEWLDSRAATEA
jgi:hypothetical protein